MTTFGSIGTLAVDTMTVTQAATSTGDITITVGGNITNYAHTVNVTAGESTVNIAAAIEAMLQGSPTVTAAYTVGGSGSEVTITQITPSATQPTLTFVDTDSTGVLVTTPGVVNPSGNTTHVDAVYTLTVGGALNTGTLTVAFSDGTINQSPTALVTAGETAANVAIAIAAALNANVPISAVYTAAASGDQVTITQKTAAANVTMTVTVTG
jgi:hypothetical protein